METDNSNIDIITLEEFAERMGVGESTVWKWIKTGKLVPGIHFIKLGRIIRFEWGPKLITKLHDISSQPEPLIEKVEIEPIKNPRRNRYGRKINFDI
jgi:excisionase family DNA binding protein